MKVIKTKGHKCREVGNLSTQTGCSTDCDRITKVDLYSATASGQSSPADHQTLRRALDALNNGWVVWLVRED